MLISKTPKTLLSKKDTIRENYGDWQTSYEFAKSICLYLKDRGISPDIIVEPTCGIGNFISAAIDVFQTVKKVYGIEIFKGYIEQAERKLQEYQTNKLIVSYELYNTDVFTFDFREIAIRNQNQNILVIGNPPWVTNSGLGKNDGMNLPIKGNIKKTKGIEAITGKGNFDIAESICNQIIDAFSYHSDTHIALLVKNSVIKNIMHRQYFYPRHIQDVRQLVFDAKKEFNVSVPASLFECHIGNHCQKECISYNFYTKHITHSFGWVNEAFVSNIKDYGQTSFLDGQSPLIWRSGIKHDCSKVMELSKNNSIYINGLKEIVDVDDITIFPLLKSSDIGKGLKGIRKYLILPQTNITENT